MAQNKKQAITVCIIVAAVTMASVAGIAVNYNLNEGQEAFARALFGEMPDVAYMLKSGDGGEAFKQRLSEHPGVRKAFGYEVSMVQLIVGGTSTATTVAEDCSLLEGNMLIDGRYPKHSNEIALGTSIARVSGKSPGDTVTVKMGDHEKAYIVTGIVQYLNANGFNGVIAEDGLREIYPEYQGKSFAVYLQDGIDVKAHIQSVQDREGDIFDSVIDTREQMQSMLGSMGGIFAAVAAGIMAVTVFVVILVLYMVIKTTILRRRRELGIQKAVGFTTFQLMNQIALNMTPVILLGVILGAAAGFFGLNPMMTALMSGMGIIKVELPVPLGQTVIVCIALAALAYAVSMLIAWRIRKISAYSLISE